MNDRNNFWTQSLPPYLAEVRYKPGQYRFEIKLLDDRRETVATAQVRATYEPVCGIDMQDGAAIQDEITRMLHRVSGRAEP